MSYNKDMLIHMIVDQLEKYNGTTDQAAERVDIPFFIAAIHQYLSGNRCKLIEELSQYPYITVDYASNPVNYGAIHIIGHTRKKDSENVLYTIFFMPEDQYNHYCDCKPGDSGYRSDKGCCGHSCDWSVPGISISKTIFFDDHKWIGDEADYWNFEDSFYLHKNKDNL